jgi:hypothetical protein
VSAPGLRRRVRLAGCTSDVPRRATGSRPVQSRARCAGLRDAGTHWSELGCVTGRPLVGTPRVSCCAPPPGRPPAAERGPDRPGDQRRRPKAALDPRKETPHRHANGAHGAHGAHATRARKTAQRHDTTCPTERGRAKCLVCATPRDGVTILEVAVCGTLGRPSLRVGPSRLKAAHRWRDQCRVEGVNYRG